MFKSVNKQDILNRLEKAYWKVDLNTRDKLKKLRSCLESTPLEMIKKIIIYLEVNNENAAELKTLTSNIGTIAEIPDNNFPQIEKYFNIPSNHLSINPVKMFSRQV